MLEIDAALRKEIDQILARYPAKEAGMLPVLYAMQNRFGSISDDVIDATAKVIDVPPAKVYGVISFYTLFKRPGEGRHTIWVCSTLTCALMGAKRVHQHLCDKLRVDKSGTSPDRLFTVKKQECLAACDRAVCVQIDDDYHYNVTPAVLDGLIEAIRGQEGQ
ncbi:MAG TPA: NAD(P)H-dependent oxidoreductase subunit E [Planctomycetota bacterium]|nr:NAD(P)H-dependent oxidoreductase subunit E [Planctomycetota bacterium]